MEPTYMKTRTKTCGPPGRIILIPTFCQSEIEIFHLLRQGVPSLLSFGYVSEVVQ